MRENMTMGEAIERLKEGKKVKRVGWNGKDQYLTLATSVSYKDLGEEEKQAWHTTMGNRAIVFHGTSGIQVGWLASQADLLSEDWMEV